MTIFQIFKNLIKPFYKRGLGRFRPLAVMFNGLFNAVKPKGVVTLRVQEWKMAVDMSDTSLSQALAIAGVWEPGVTALLRRIVKPGMVVIDVGANIGYFTILCSRLVGIGGKVYAFEPESKNFNALCNNLTLNQCSNVVVTQKAVSDTEGPAYLLLHPTGWGAHKLSSLCSPISALIETITLDNFMADSDRVDIAKIDVEGAELKVLRGMPNIIMRNPAIKIILEFWPEGVTNMGDLPQDLWGICQEQSFTIF